MAGNATHNDISDRNKFRQNVHRGFCKKQTTND
jgi:hypothetical protein